MANTKLQQRIAEVFKVQQAGQLDSAERSYRQLLAANPGQVDVLYLPSALLPTTPPREAADLPVGPYSEDTCWAQAVQVMPAALAVTRDVPVRVEAVQSQFRISFHPI